jgi:hypothetical protein
VLDGIPRGILRDIAPEIPHSFDHAGFCGIPLPQSRMWDPTNAILPVSTLYTYFYLKISLTKIEKFIFIVAISTQNNELRT